MERKRPTKPINAKSNRGGYRPNGGRPKGARNKVPNTLREEAAKLHVQKGGKMPLEFMLDVLRLKTVKGHEVTWEDRMWAAEKTLHVFTPKLKATELSGPEQGPLRVLFIDPMNLKGLSDNDLRVLERALGGLQRGDFSGEGGEAEEGDADVFARTINGNGKGL